MATQTEIYDATKEAVVGALGVGEDEVTPEATLMDDLGAESIDLLDILFRIERSTGVKVQASDIGEYIHVPAYILLQWVAPLLSEVRDALRRMAGSESQDLRVDWAVEVEFLLTSISARLLPRGPE